MSTRLPSFTLFTFLSLAACGGRLDDRSSASAGDLTGLESEDAGKGDDGPGVDAGDAALPESPPPLCVPGGEGGGGTGTSCVPQTELETSAREACKRTGLASIAYSQPCDGWFRQREFNCCTPDGVCGPKRIDGHESSCKDVNTWRKYSIGDCEREGKVLGEITYRTPCGGPLGYKSYSYTCCK